MAIFADRGCFFEVLERIAQLQRKQAPQARAVLGRSEFGLVEDFDGHGVTHVDQRRKADQGLRALADLHELGQRAESPGGVAFASARGLLGAWRSGGSGTGGWARRDRRGGNSFFASCLCLLYLGLRPIWL